MTKHRSLFAGWASLAVGLLLTSTAIVMGVLVAAPAQAAALGTIELSPSSGSVDANPMFGTATTSAPCPATFGEEARLRVVPASGEVAGLTYFLTPALGGGGYDQAAVVANPNRSFTAANGGAAPADGQWIVVVECFSLTQGKHADRFETTITVCGTQWFEGIACSSTKTPTTTTITVSPTGRVDEGTAVNLSATVSPPEATGTVQFHRISRGDSGGDVDVAIGDPVPVSGGTAQLAPTVLPLGAHKLYAAFSATGDVFDSSNSTQVDLDVVPPGGTSVTLAVSPDSPQPQGTAVTLTATVTPDDVAGNVEFRRITSSTQFPVGTAVHTDGGVATLTVSDLPVGTHNLSARFIPDDEAHLPSEFSAGIGFQITGPGGGAATTTTTLAVTPSGAQPAGTELTLTATVSPPAAPGQVTFLDGSTTLGSPQPVANGQAVLRTSSLTVGSHSLTARFTSSAADQYANSESTVATVEITGDDDGDGNGDDNGYGDDNGNGDDNDNGNGDNDGNGNGGSDTGGGGSLAVTGASLTTMGASGLALVVVGAGALILSRRRRREPLPATSWPDVGTGGRDRNDEEAE
jgi:hypothetical protein